MTHPARLTSLAPLVAEALGVPAPSSATDLSFPRSLLPNAFFSADRILLLVLDSWGEVNWRKASGQTPYLSSIDERFRIGVLSSVMPSITPVNFTSIATGAAPEIHGVASRTGRSAVPTLFETASAAGRSTSVVGPDDSSSVLVLGPTADTCLVAQTKADSNAEVALMLVRHLVEVRPDFVLSQWLDLDTVGHAHGPLTQDHLHTYASTDRLLRHTLPLAQRLGYWILVTADHGMHARNDGDSGDLGMHGSDAAEDVLVPLWLVPPSRGPANHVRHAPQGASARLDPSRARC